MEREGKSRDAFDKVKLRARLIVQNTPDWFQELPVTSPDDPGYTVRISLHCKNIGPTAAIHTFFLGGIFPVEDLSNIPDPREEFNVSFYTGDSGTKMKFLVRPREFSQDEYEAMSAINPTKWLCLRGRIRYQDIFEDWWEREITWLIRWHNGFPSIEIR